MLPPADDNTVNEIPEWRTNVYDNAFIRRCMCIADGCGKRDVGELLHAYVEDKYFRQKRITCVDLALSKNRLDMVKVLRKAGGRFRGDVSLRLAVNTGNHATVRYLEKEGCVPDGGVLSLYLLEIPDSLQYIQYLLENKFVEIDNCSLGYALSLKRANMVDLLLRFGAPVADITIDQAIAEWDFERARSLMARYGCRPTPKAYFWLFSQGVDVDLMMSLDTGALQLDFDEVYLEGLELIFCATDYRLPLGFETFQDMEESRVWSVILKWLSSDVVQWFRDRLPDGMQVEE